ncbi:hypothetical protein Scep_020333 [Stephania cephalantha]|uniref:Alpha/beta hydrolase fold-3 domain-containing protein n=1 Tax=Stephania cephalantha TaxID=152367 RepID=A0AAP0ICF8_9MAGN
MEFESLFMRIKDGRVERLMGTEFIPPSTDPETGVSSKDAIIDPTTGVSARLFLPRTSNSLKLPILIYFHGGGFCVESPFSPAYHAYVNTLSAELNALAVSINYRLAPEHPLPTAYNDACTAIKWIDGGQEEWLRDYGDLDRVFLMGDSCGANICHQMGMRWSESLFDVKFKGVVLINPYFWGEERIGFENNEDCKFLGGDLVKLWHIVCPELRGYDEAFVNPVGDGAPSLDRLGCERVVVCVAELDPLRERGRAYYEKLRESGWGGVAEFVEVMGEGHVFHLFKPESDKAQDLMKLLVDFVNHK